MGRSPASPWHSPPAPPAAEIEIAGHNDDLRAGIEQFLRGNGAAGDVAFGVAVHHLERPAQNAAFGIEVFDRHFRGPRRIGVVGGDEPALRDGRTDENRVLVGGERASRAAQCECN